MDRRRSRSEGKRTLMRYQDDDDDVDEEEEQEQEEEDEEEKGYGGVDEEEEEYGRRKRTMADLYSNKKGSKAGSSAEPRLCQVESCDSDLSYAKHYYQRHKVCEDHSKAPSVLVGGHHQRFCQQCSRFHELSEFDDSKRSCRKRLAGHNERRRKNAADYHGE